MKAIELRIGNLVIVTNTGGYNNIGDIISIDSISRHGVNNWSDMGSSGCNPFCGIEPILLTEEWLLKFGFLKDRINLYYSFGQFIIRHDFILCDINTRIELKYVHQLQNLYFALIGQELIIK